MATIDDEYIKSNMLGNLYKCERHNIVGQKNGDADEKNVYRINKLNNEIGSIRNKYTCPNCMPDYYTEKELKESFTTSSKEAYDTEHAAASEKAKLRPQYDKEFGGQYSLKNFGGNEALARRRGWMPFEEWFAKKKAGKPMYSRSELNGAVSDAMKRSHFKQHTRK